MPLDVCSSTPSPATRESHTPLPLTADERGNRILIIVCSLNILVLYPGTKAYYMWRNRQRAKIWDAMTAEASPRASDRMFTDPVPSTGESALSEDHKGRWE